MVSIIPNNPHSSSDFYITMNEKLEDINEDVQNQITQLHLVGRYGNLEAITSLNFSFCQFNQLEHLSIGSLALFDCKEVVFRCMYI